MSVFIHATQFSWGTRLLMCWFVHSTVVHEISFRKFSLMNGFNHSYNIEINSVCVTWISITKLTTKPQRYANIAATWQFFKSSHPQDPCFGKSFDICSVGRGGGGEPNFRSHRSINMESNNCF